MILISIYGILQTPFTVTVTYTVGFDTKRQAASKMVVPQPPSNRSLPCQLSFFNYPLSSKKRKLVLGNAHIALVKSFKGGERSTNQCVIIATGACR